jgi:RimJ/RimL family protein N-acetyltransferase
MEDAGWPRAEALTTERLSLEPLRPDHAPEMAPVLADHVLYAYTGGSPPTEQELAALYVRQARGVSPDGRHGWLNWVLRLRSDDRVVGFVQATLSDEERRLGAELAWLLARRDQGAGLATEGASAVVAWLRTRGVGTFTAHIHPDHDASAAVAGRLGLVATRVLVDGETRWSTPAPTR